MKLSCKKCGDSIDTREMMELDGFCNSCANDFMLDVDNKKKDVKQKSPVHISSINQARQIVKQTGYQDIISLMINTGNYGKIQVKPNCIRKSFADPTLKNCLFYILMTSPFEYCYRCPEVLPHLSSFINTYLEKSGNLPIGAVESDASIDNDLLDFFLDVCEPICLFGFEHKCELNPLDTQEQLKWCYKNYMTYGLEIITRYDKIKEKSLKRRRDSIIKNMDALSEEEYIKLPYIRKNIPIYDNIVTSKKKPKKILPKIMFFGEA